MMDLSCGRWIFLLFGVLCLAKSAKSSSEFRYIGSYRASSYYVSTVTSTWNAALTECIRSDHGNLISVESQAEDLEVRLLMIENDIQDVWTAGGYDVNKGKYYWVKETSEEVQVNDWAPWEVGHPIQQNGYCIAIHNTVFGHSNWYTDMKTKTLYYICEKEIPTSPTTEVVTETTTPGPDTTSKEPEITTGSPEITTTPDPYLEWICPTDYVGNIGHPDTCSIYYTCQVAPSPPIRVACEVGLYFDAWDQYVCRYPFEVPQCAGGTPPPGTPSPKPPPSYGRIMQEWYYRYD